jgi:hypothetical protein
MPKCQHNPPIALHTKNSGHPIITHALPTVGVPFCPESVRVCQTVATSSIPPPRWTTWPRTLTGAACTGELPPLRGSCATPKLCRMALVLRTERDQGVTLLRISSCRVCRRDASELGELSWEGVTDVSVRRGNPSWPCGRWGHSLVVIDGGSAVVYGGESQDETCSDIQLLDTRTWQWQCIKCTGESPERRFGHSCVYYEGNIIIFGGSKGAGYYDDLCCLDVKRWHWWRPNCRGTPPMKRSSHSMTVVGNKGYVFGGIGGDGTAQCLQDISILDMDKWEWSQPEVLGEKPDGRFVHRVVAIGDELLLFGGRTSMNVKFNDVHWFNTNTLTWRSDPVSSPPCGWERIAMMVRGLGLIHSTQLHIHKYTNTQIH